MQWLHRACSRWSSGVLFGFLFTACSSSGPAVVAAAGSGGAPLPSVAGAGAPAVPSPPLAGTGAPALPSAGAPAPGPDAGLPAADGGGADDDDAGVVTIRQSPGVGTVEVQGAALSATIRMTEVRAGEESHECVIVELPNSAEIWVKQLRATLSDGSHHLIVDRSPPGTPVSLEARSCSPTMGSDATRLMIAQMRETRLELPRGVAYRLDAQQRVNLQMHYINVTSTTAQITGRVELLTADPSEKLKEAKSLFTGATSILIPAGKPATVSSFHKPVEMSQPPLHVFALTSHTHKLGVRSTIERVAALDAPNAASLHESLNWAEPPLTVFKTPLDFNGSDGLRLTCRYENTSARDVSFGVSANDEMCFMWMYYYE
jgi:hypothetical protein